MATERDDARGRKIARQLDGLLDEGQSMLVRCETGVIKVFEVEGEDDELTRVSPLRDSHPELYGRMLALDQAVDKAGGFLLGLLWIVTTVTFVLTWSGALDGLFGLALGHIISFWMILPFVIVMGIVTSQIGNVFEKAKYAGLRGALHAAIDGSGLTLPTVLSKIEGDQAVSNLAERLKIDIERGPAKDSW
jgi:hypothetical protein